MTTAQWLGAVLSLWGATGMYVAGKGAWKGWAMGLAAQPIWVAFALVVHSWPLVLSPLLYGTVYARNLLRWKVRNLEEPAPRVQRLYGVRVVKDRVQYDAPRRVRREAARQAKKA